MTHSIFALICLGLSAQASTSEELEEFRNSVLDRALKMLPASHDALSDLDDTTLGKPSKLTTNVRPAVAPGAHFRGTSRETGLETLSPQVAEKLQKLQTGLVQGMCSAPASKPVPVVRASGADVKPKYRVAVVGGGPAGASAAEVFADDPDVEVFMFERKMNNAKPCGGAIPLCMVGEFDLPSNIIDRKVRRMTLISPTDKEVSIGQTLKDNEYIGMTRREVFDKFLRDRAVEKGAKPINALVLNIDLPKTEGEKYTIHYNPVDAGKTNKGAGFESLEVDLIIGADGANSKVAKAIDAGEYNYAIAFQERIKLSDELMKPYEDMAEMYVGDDVSPDFYGWVFPKYDHVGVGTGTVVNRPAIKQYQQGMRDRAKDKLKDGKIIKVEAHPIPEHYRPKRVVGRVALVGDAAGYVTKCSGEGIYFAAKSGRMAAEAIVKVMREQNRLPTEDEIKETYLKDYDKAYFPTYTVLDILQKVFYTTNAAREAFVEMCESEYVQKVTFDSYLYKKVQGNNPIEDLKLLFGTVGSLIKHSATSKPDKEFSNPVESLNRLGSK
jgi:geranylgeranyl reductase